MYGELLEAWRQELESVELVKLAPGFYGKAADYLKHLREESRMLDRRTSKARLHREEMQNARRLLRGLVQLRFKKLIRKVSDGEKVASELLTVEEEKICLGCSPIMEAYQGFAKGLLRGQVLGIEAAKQRRRVALRFLKEVPEIIGADVRTYGPFKVEDVASLPTENAQILTKQGLTEKVELS